jgi:hypothetical protein
MATETKFAYPEFIDMTNSNGLDVRLLVRNIGIEPGHEWICSVGGLEEDDFVKTIVFQFYAATRDKAIALGTAAIDDVVANDYLMALSREIKAEIEWIVRTLVIGVVFNVHRNDSVSDFRIQKEVAVQMGGDVKGLAVRMADETLQTISELVANAACPVALYRFPTVRVSQNGNGIIVQMDFNLLTPKAVR